MTASVAPTERPFSAEVIGDAVPHRSRHNQLSDHHPLDRGRFHPAIQHGLFGPVNHPDVIRLFVNLDASCENVSNLNWFGQRDNISAWKLDYRHGGPPRCKPVLRSKGNTVCVDAATRKLQTCNSPSRPANFTGRALPPARFQTLGGPQHCLARVTFIPMRRFAPARGLAVHRAPLSPSGRTPSPRRSPHGAQPRRAVRVDASALARQGGTAEHLFSFPILSRALNSGHPGRWEMGAGFRPPAGRKAGLIQLVAAGGSAPPWPRRIATTRSAVGKKAEHRFTRLQLRDDDAHSVSCALVHGFCRARLGAWAGLG